MSILSVRSRTIFDTIKWERPLSMTSASITVLIEAWQEHQLTNRELITEARQLTPEDRTILRRELQQTVALQHAAAPATALSS